MSVRGWVTATTTPNWCATSATLGYLRPEWTTLDATYGLGRFWKLWRPEVLIGNDLHTEADTHHSFT